MKFVLTVGPLFCLIGVFIPKVAQASKTYPETLQVDVGIKCPPRCTLCHETESGGARTLVGFGLSAYRAGLRGVNANSLPAALEKLEDARTDTDNDGVADVEELRRQTDPNSRSNADICTGEEMGGCTVMPGQTRAAGSGILVLVCLLLARRPWRS